MALTPDKAWDENGSLIRFSSTSFRFSKRRNILAFSSFLSEISASSNAVSSSFLFRRSISAFNLSSLPFRSSNSNLASSNRLFVCLIFSSEVPVSIAYLRFSSISILRASNFWISFTVLNRLSVALLISLSTSLSSSLLFWLLFSFTCIVARCMVICVSKSNRCFSISALVSFNRVISLTSTAISICSSLAFFSR